MESTVAIVLIADIATVLFLLVYELVIDGYVRYKSTAFPLVKKLDSVCDMILFKIEKEQYYTKHSKSKSAFKRTGL